MEDLQKLFFNDAGRLRSGWRLGIFVVIFFFLAYAATQSLRIIYLLIHNSAPGLQPGGPVADLISRFLLLFLALGAGYICARLLEGLPWRSLGLTLHSGWLRDLIVGTTIGLVSLALATAIAFAGGGLQFSFSTASASLVVITMALSAALFFVAALAEEALCRGYPLQTFTRAKLIWVGVLVTSLPFAAGHLDNPNAGKALAFVNTVLAGIWLAVAYLRTRSLWFPLGVHWGWNWALGALFGLPVSGTTDIAPHPVLAGSDLGPAWLTGAAYGIEGGIACTVALVISTIFLWRTRLVSATEDLKKLTSQENPAATGNIGVPDRIPAEQNLD